MNSQRAIVSTLGVRKDAANGQDQVESAMERVHDGLTMRYCRYCGGPLCRAQFPSAGTGVKIEVICRASGCHKRNTIDS